MTTDHPEHPRPRDGETPRKGRRGQRNRGRGRRPGAVRDGRPPQVTSAQLERAAQKRRDVVVPPISYPEQLPVSARREDIAAAMRDHQVVIVAGETGSGKTTQIPKIALELGRGRDGQIGHTQPRRIAARSVAERIAEELGTTLGEIVGYQVRFTDQSSERTLVKVMTDGILLAQIQRDPDLRAYDTLIIDEAHERSLNIDFLLGYLTRLLPRRPDLKVVITSATIDSQRFARHFAPGGPLPLVSTGSTDEALIEPVEIETGLRQAQPPEVEPDETGTGLRQAQPPEVEPVEIESAPVIEVTGRTFPVEIRYRPLVADGTKRGEEKDLVTGIVDAAKELTAEGPGDILVFLSGEREIHDAQDALESWLGERARDTRHPQHVEILPLYSRLSAAEQHRVFQAHSSRRIVLATNVAETSLTVPGIHYVIDPGTARISRYSKATKVQRLPIEPIARASANQRSGRSGRVADGIAIRLYSEEDFEARPAFTEPEILRTSLASVLLQMISVGVVSSPDDVARFPFVESPDTRAVRDGVQLLTELGAVTTTTGKGTSKTRLTDVGRAIAQLPMDPRLARMIWEGAKHDVAREVAIVAAALSIQDPRERPAESRDQADQLHRRFADPRSDFLTYLNLWEYVRTQQHELSSSKFRRLCKSEYINFLRVREWQDVVAQLREMSRPLGIDLSHTRVSTGSTDATQVEPVETRRVEPVETTDTHLRHTWNDDAIHKSILAGLLSQIGMQETNELKASSFTHLKGPAREQAIRRAKKQARNEYLGARGARFAIFPGSPLSKKPPAWVMAGELVETSRLWGRDVARIEPEWAESLAGPLAKYTYSEPHWSSKQGSAQATEKVLLYGVPIVSDRAVLWGKVDPDGAREMFVRHALVEGEWRTHHRFWAENQRLLAEAEELEARSRTRGLVIDDDAIFAFYDARVPADIVSARHFDRWWKTAQRTTPDLLTFTLDQLVPEAASVDTSQFPEIWPQGDLELPLTYQFQPGTDADGVTVHVPISVLTRISPDGFDWMVPGLLDELATATIRALPKPVRRQLVPAPDVARDVVAWLRANTPAWEDMARAGDMAESFRAAFTRAVSALRDVEIPDDAWDGAAERLPAHLRMTYRVTEERAGSTMVLDESTDLLALQRRLKAQGEAAVRTAVRGAVGAALAEAEASSRASGPSGPSSGSHPSSPSSPSSPSRRGPNLSRPGPHHGLDKLDQQPGDGGSSLSSGGSSLSSGGSSLSRPEPAQLVSEQTDLSTWPEGLPDDALPDEVSTDVGGGVVVRGYPALVEELDAKQCPAVALRVLADAGARDAAHARGVVRLLVGETSLPTKRITSRWSGTQALTLAASPYRNTEALVADLQLAAVQSILTAPAAIRDAAAYRAARDVVRTRLEDEVHTIVGHVTAALTAARELDVAIKDANSLALLNTLTDLRDTAAGLVGRGFVSATPPDRLRHLTRYLRAASYRLEKAAQNPNRDAELAWRVHDVEEAYGAARAALAQGRPDPERAAQLAEVRWMIEELRVSLFAQQLGTDGSVSEKRIRKVLSS
nr:DUF3418 domain-containing protein [Paraoerskovia marina]